MAVFIPVMLLSTPAPKRILCIAYYYPPIHSVGVLRNYFLLSHLAAYTDHITVLTTANARLFRQDTSLKEVPAINRIAVKTFDYRTLMALRTPQTGNIHFAETQKSNPIIQFLIRLNDTVPFSLLAGEGGLVYILSAFVKALSCIKKHTITHIHTPFRTPSDIFTSYLLKLRFPNLHWTVDFHDLPVDSVRHNNFFPKLQWAFYRKLLRRAFLVTTVSDGLAINLATALQREVYTLREGIVLPAQRKVLSNTCFTIAYTGSLYQDKRDPAMLLKVIQECLAEGIIDRRRFKIRYAGKESIIWQKWIEAYQLQAIFEDEGLVDRAKAIEIQQTSHINLLLSWATPENQGFMTGKIYEYFAAQNCILLLLKGSIDTEMERVIADFQAGKVIYTDITSEYAVLKTYLTDLYHAWHNGRFPTPFIPTEHLAAHSWRHTAAKFWSLSYPS